MIFRKNLQFNVRTVSFIYFYPSTYIYTFAISFHSQQPAGGILRE